MSDDEYCCGCPNCTCDACNAWRSGLYNDCPEHAGLPATTVDRQRQDVEFDFRVESIPSDFDAQLADAMRRMARSRKWR